MRGGAVPGIVCIAKSAGPRRDQPEANQRRPKSGLAKTRESVRWQTNEPPPSPSLERGMFRRCIVQ